MNLLIIISIMWIISEIVLARVKVSSARAKNKDKFSLQILWITIIVSITLGNVIRYFGIGFIYTHSEFIHNLGLALIVLGLIIRWIAILKLKSMFTVNVSIRGNHKIVKTGIYKTIRHPAYLGSLLSFLGLGLGLAFVNWLSIIIIFVPIVISFINRIQVEEKVLIAEFGEDYLNYSNNTHRLFPGIY
jgi:protein-S-isoprenylcysteine O-methyltransferase Ste14